MAAELTIRELQSICFQNAEDKGFHERGNKILSSGSTDDQNDYIGSRLLLLVSEIAEAQDELRMGNHYSKQYSSESHNALGEVVAKPEGFASEIADVVIRALDLCGELGIDLAEVIDLKMNYNSTRARLHGKAF